MSRKLSISEMASKKPQADGDVSRVDFANLDLEHLGMVRQQIEREAQLLEQSLGSLKFAHQGFSNSYDAVVSGMKSENEGSQILVPLTESLYVPGKLKNPRVLDMTCYNNTLTTL